MENKMLMWCNNVMIDKEVQAELESKVKDLLKGPLRNKSEYAQEKCIKSFYEAPMYLEKILLKDRGVHPHDSHDIMNNIAMGRITKEEVFRKQEEVKNILMSEISRQFRHYLTFL